MRRVLSLVISLLALVGLSLVATPQASALETATNCTTINRPLGHDPKVCLKIWYSHQNDGVGFILHSIRVWNDDNCAGLETDQYAVLTSGLEMLNAQAGRPADWDVTRGLGNASGANNCTVSHNYLEDGWSGEYSRPRCNTANCTVEGRMHIRVNNYNDQNPYFSVAMLP